MPVSNKRETAFLDFKVFFYFMLGFMFSSEMYLKTAVSVEKA